MNKPKPSVGQTLFKLNIGNNARHKVLTRVVVTQVGRKYFTVGEGYSRVEFRLDNWRERTEYKLRAIKAILDGATPPNSTAKECEAGK